MELSQLVKAAIIAGLALSLSTPFSCRPSERAAPESSHSSVSPPRASTSACGPDADCSANPAPSPAFGCLDPRARP